MSSSPDAQRDGTHSPSVAKSAWFSALAQFDTTVQIAEPQRTPGGLQATLQIDGHGAVLVQTRDPARGGYGNYFSEVERHPQPDWVDETSWEATRDAARAWLAGQLERLDRGATGHHSQAGAPEPYRYQVRACVEDAYEVISGVPEDRAQFWTVYEISPGGINTALEDYPTRAAAEEACNLAEAWWTNPDATRPAAPEQVESLTSTILTERFADGPYDQVEFHIGDHPEAGLHAVIAETYEGFVPQHDAQLRDQASKILNDRLPDHVRRAMATGRLDALGDHIHCSHNGTYRWVRPVAPTDPGASRQPPGVPTRDRTGVRHEHHHHAQPDHPSTDRGVPR